MSVFVTRPADDLVSVDTTAMLGWWLFDEGTGDAIHDRTGFQSSPGPEAGCDEDVPRVTIRGEVSILTRP